MCSSPALIHGAHRVLDDEGLYGVWAQQQRDCVTDLKDVLKQGLGRETSNVISETTRGIVQVHEPTDRWVGVGVDVTFCLWEKKNGGTAVDDVTDDVTVSQSKFCSQSLSALQQIFDEFFL